MKEIQGYIHAKQSNKNQLNVSYLKVVVVTRLLPRDEGMAEDHGAPEAGQLSWAWTRDCTEIESRQKASDAKSLQLDFAE